MPRTDAAPPDRCWAKSIIAGRAGIYEYYMAASGRNVK